MRTELMSLIREKLWRKTTILRTRTVAPVRLTQAGTALPATKVTGPFPTLRATSYFYQPMTSESIKQDFDSALLKHFAFKAKLRSFLYGNKSEEGPLRDPDQCSLGKWISERKAGEYAGLAEMHTLDHLHRHMHQLANHLVDLHLAGHRDEAMAGFKDVQVLADDMVVLFQTIVAKLRKAEA
jgi:hypothetical protein